MRQFVTIAANAFMELVRQPVFLLLITSSAAFEVFLATPYYFAFGDEPKLVKNSTLAVMLLSGLFGAVLSASASLAREIRTGTALAVLSKPIGRAQFLLAKYLGLIAALTVMTYVNMVAALIASRMTFDVYSGTDLPALGIFCGAVLIAYAFAGFSNFFLRRPFASDAVFALVAMVTIGAFITFQFTTQKETIGVMGQVDWRLVPASVLVLLALWILAAVALACSTRLDMIPTLAVCSAVFLLGLMSDYLFGRHAVPVWQFDLREETESPQWNASQKALLKQILEKYDQDRSGALEEPEREHITAPDKARLAAAGMGGAWWASVLYTVVPNWQLFWLADVLETGQTAFTSFPWGYVGRALLYAVCYVGAVLSFAVLFFQERELS